MSKKKGELTPSEMGEALFEGLGCESGALVFMKDRCCHLVVPPGQQAVTTLGLAEALALSARHALNSSFARPPLKPEKEEK